MKTAIEGAMKRKDKIMIEIISYGIVSASYFAMFCYKMAEYTAP